MFPVIVDQASYRDGVRRACFDLSDTLAELRTVGGPQDFLWIGLHDPTQAELDDVSEELELHELAIEDVISGRQRPKIERYHGSLFVVLKTLRYVDATSDVETGEVMVWVGDRFVVTVRKGPLNPLAGIRKRLESDPRRLRLGPMSVVHAVMDHIVDGYVVVDRELEVDVEDMEAAIFGDDRGTVSSADVYRLKREVLEARRAVVPMVSPVEYLATGDGTPVAEGELRLLFRDVSDHLKSVSDHVEGFDRLLADILSAHLAQVGVAQNDVAMRQNEDMRRISAWVAIAALPTMIAGIYGMNFDNMPELRQHYGYFVVLAVMVVSCSALYRAFRRSGWL